VVQENGGVKCSGEETLEGSKPRGRCDHPLERMHGPLIEPLAYLEFSHRGISEC
jgi:hypothetical protein